MSTMTLTAPAEPGFYFYELPGIYPKNVVYIWLNPEANELMFALDPLYLGQTDENRDGWLLRTAAPGTLWGPSPLEVPDDIDPPVGEPEPESEQEEPVDEPEPEPEEEPGEEE